MGVPGLYHYIKENSKKIIERSAIPQNSQLVIDGLGFCHFIRQNQWVLFIAFS